MTEIRKADSNDSDSIAEIMLSFYNIKNKKEAEEAVLNEIRNGHYFIVLFSENNIIGFASWILHGLPKHGLAELDRIAFLPEYRGRGLGKILFDGLMKNVKEHYKKNNSFLRKLYVLTHEDNKIAQEFYEKMGFKRETILEDHYYKNVNEHMMSMFFEEV